MKESCRLNKYNKYQKGLVYKILANRHSIYGYQVTFLNSKITIRHYINKNPIKYLHIKVNVPDLLSKSIITELDLNLFKEKYLSLVHHQIFNFDSFLKTETLNRIDYKFDYMCKDEEEKSNLLEVLSKATDKRYSLGKCVYKKENSSQTVYYRSKFYKINVYDKDEQSKKLQYKNTIRYEIQILSRIMNRYFKGLGFIRNIDNYWNMRMYFFKELLVPILYTGDYYKNNIISRMLNRCKNKDILMKKIMEIQRSHGFCKAYSYEQIKQLNHLNINPLQNNFNLVNPLKSVTEERITKVS